MRARLLLGVSTLMCLLDQTSRGSPAEAGAESARVRNVLFIMGDDHAAYAVRAYGNSIIRTPNLDQLAAKSVRFAQAFANSPVCTPSRQSILTGKYPHANGVSLLTTPLAEAEATIADHVKELGYSTGAIGKMHFNSDLKHGFDYRLDERSFSDQLTRTEFAKPSSDIRVKPQWRPFRDPARGFWNADVLPYPLYDKDMRGAWYVKKAAEFLRTNREKPFCLWVSFNEPHAPFDFPIEYARKYRSQQMPLPDAGAEDERWIPTCFRDLTKADKQGIVASYYTSVEYLDKNVGLLLRELRDLGLEKNTLVVYVSDHGYLLGHHGRFEKHTMWDEALRVPLLIFNKSLSKTGRVVNAMVETIDLVPTILEVLGLRAMEGLQGKSLAPLLKGETTQGKELIFAEYHDDNKAMVRTAQWKYIFTSGKHDLAHGYATGYGPSGRNQRLYHLIEDPQEFHNLSNDSRYAQVLKTLQAKMLEVFKTTDPRAPKLPEGLSVEEKLEWFCEPPEK